jgi:alpha-L-rhamnosidase
LEVAYALLKQTSWPSWLYSITQGATTIWERWDGWTHDKGFQDPRMNSFNHYAYGAIGAWLYAVTGGIDLHPDVPGYKHILMHPRPGGGLTHASASLDSMYGLIQSSWSLEAERFTWQVVIPPNATATLFIPASDVSEVLESGRTSTHAPGLTFLRLQDGCAVFHAQSGAYTLSSRIA